MLEDIDVPSTVKDGYEISFTRPYCKPATLRSLEGIRADILAPRCEAKGLLREILDGIPTDG